MPRFQTLGIVPGGTPALDPQPVVPVDLGNGVSMITIPPWAPGLSMGEGFTWDLVRAMAGYPAFALSIEFEGTDLNDPDSLGG